MFLYGITLALGGLQVAWPTVGQNQVANTIAAKFGWTPEETRFYNTMVNLFSQGGKTFGAFVGGYLFKSGRKRPFIYANWLCAIAAALTLVENIWAIIIGRFLHGCFGTIIQLA